MLHEGRRQGCTNQIWSVSFSAFRRFIGMFCTRKRGIFDWRSPSPLPKTFLITQKNPSGTSSGQVLLFICTLPSTAWLLFNKQLFKSNFSAFSLKFSFELFSFCFGSTLFEDFRSTVNYFFSFFQAKSCSFTYNFDNFNFVWSNFC